MEIIQFLKKRGLLTIIGTVTVIATCYFIYKYFVQTDSTQTNNTSNVLSTETVTKGNITSSVSASGTIQTSNFLPITTSVNGIVNKVYVKEGDKVKKGDKIMEITLDSEGEKSKTSAYASYLKAKSNLDSAKNNLYAAESNVIQKDTDFETEKKNNTYQTDQERNSFKIAENSYLAAKRDYEIKKTEITQLQLGVSTALSEYQAQSPTIIAPYDGVIANIVSVEGNAIQNSVSERSVQTVASIKLEGTPSASLNISEVDINSVKVGQKVNITLTALGKNHTGIVAGIDKIGTTSNGVANYPIIIKFDEVNDEILPNMSVDVEIITNEKQNVLIVPTAALTVANGKTYINLLENGESKSTEVKVGTKTDDKAEIISGLVEGQQIAVTAYATSGFTSSDDEKSGSNSRGITTPFGGTAPGSNIQMRSH